MPKQPIHLGSWAEDEQKAYLGEVKIGKEGASYSGSGAMRAGTPVGKPSHQFGALPSKEVKDIVSPPTAKKAIAEGTVMDMKDLGFQRAVPTPLPAPVASGSMTASLNQLEKAAEKHYGRHYGTKDPKGSLSRIARYKTKDGQIKKPPRKTDAKQEMASEMIAHHMHHLGRHPGGEKQAVAIGLHQAGLSKEKSMNKSFDELMEISKAVEKSDLEKAVTARSVPRLPRALAHRSTFESGSALVTKDISALATGPLTPQLIDELKQDEAERTHRIAKAHEHIRCGACGRAFAKSFGECPTCVINKSQCCKSCGGQMVKKSDNTMRCPRCG